MTKCELNYVQGLRMSVGGKSFGKIRMQQYLEGWLNSRTSDSWMTAE